ncbi:DNA polymerase III subunit delta' [Caviibacterium pharyngocola]|uniref:DNA polymerase III subunit delta' n=1 Tax=Caviibacterium pharyngocola TaxID=28159 RepID=A0A2M8RYE8_9PAST|nr:DNA polymerase III subunit delta' [Caviibacterium pharyngocola]PJG83906.1 DNA polymerase III subunit delta' [Caviibacterium pharyngocola]
MHDLYPWLQPYYDKIIDAFRRGRGHHALLFKSEQGVGVEQLIRATAQRLICTQPHENAPCGQCHACRLLVAGNHPDVYYLASQENRDIGIEQVREINEKLTQFAQQNGNKILFVKEAERLTESAANAMLKTLEEPRPNTYFLLQTDVSAPLLATIYSRCQVWTIHLPAERIALNWLAQQGEWSAEEREIALRVNYGRPLSALTMLQQNLLEKRKMFLRQFWLFYSRRSPLELLPFFDNALIFQQLDWLASFLSDALKAKLGISQGLINTDLARGIEQFNAQQSAQDLLQANAIIAKVRSDLAQINGVNQELILLDGLTRLITDVFEKKDK